MPRRLVQHLATPAGAALALAVLVVLAAAVVPHLLSAADPLRIEGGQSLAAPSWRHPLGADLLGKDVLSEIVYGTRTTLLIAAAAVVLSLVAGTTLGLVSGFWGGTLLDEALMRCIDALYIFPDLILALTIVAILGPEHAGSIVVALAVGHVPAYARLVRARVLSLREAEFVVAARSIGAPVRRILARHVLPQTSDVIVARSVIGLAGIILGESALSFLGLGVQPPAPSWGRMLRDGFQYLGTAPWVALSPGAAILAAVFVFNQAGEAIRDLLDPQATTRAPLRGAVRRRLVAGSGRDGAAPSVSAAGT